jgi:hypothetical protein
MFTVLSNTRNFNLYLIAALAIMMVVLLTFAVAPATSAPNPVLAPVSGFSETGSDYYQRHPELRASVQDAARPVTDNSEGSDYFQRHPELSAPIESLETPGMACESPVDCR